ncbi:FHA domain-containing protein [Sandaracinus amylolyticus]|uniref:FHA domain-containing protein n=1 Tax=Sandaracinus amylolyticus TaxID=927083 RepID=UPI001F1D8565|nr:FHA domain-containing protein [Sandaracinus amylolyticus]UJR86249.1 Hypothetical protein I5071_83310 [Sandaracinus amylolyticus]
MNDQNKKTLRQFQCRDYLWEIFEQMSGELECSVDYLINEAMRQYARSRNYGARTGPTPDPTGQRARPEPTAQQGRQRVPSQPAIPSAPPPPPARASYPQPGAPSYGQPSPAPIQGSGPGGYPPPPGRSSPGGYPAPPAQQPPAAYGGAGYGAPAPQAYGAPPMQPQSQAGYGGAPYGGAPAPGYPAQPPSYPAASSPGGYPAPPGYGAPPPRPAAPAAPSSYPPPPQTTRPPAYGAGGGAPAPSSYGAPPPLPSAAPPLPGAGGGTHPAGMPTLFVIFNGQKFPVNKEEFIIGRGTKTADLAIKDGNISRRHAAVIFQNGGFYMKDLGSTNGVEFQGRRVDGKRIEEGDVYQLCDYELRFTYR